MFSFSASSQFDDLMRQIEDLSVNEEFTLTYTKSGDWGTYEGGKMTFRQTTEDTISIALENEQNYLGAETKTSSTSYDKLTLLNTLNSNKKNYYKDPDNIVFNNRFHYKIEKEGTVITTSSLPMEPTDVVNMVSLNNNLKSIFLKEEKSIFGKGSIKIN